MRADAIQEAALELELDDAGLAALLEGLALSVEPLSPPSSAKERLVGESAEPGKRFFPFLDRLTKMVHLGVDTVKGLLAKIDDATAWEPMGPDIGLMHLPTAPATAGADVGFVKLRAGARFPVHTHLGAETVLVLQGGFRDEDGTEYVAGDVVEEVGDTTHYFDALPGPDLVYAVVVFGVEFHPELTPPKT